MIFDWDEGNRNKCEKHGASVATIEAILNGEPMVRVDPYPDDLEPRYRAIGKTADGRHLFVVFTLRVSDGGMKVRPVSARYMHQKEISYYERS